MNIEVEYGTLPLPFEDLYEEYFSNQGVINEAGRCVNIVEVRAKDRKKLLCRLRMYKNKRYVRNGDYGDYEPLPDTITTDDEAIVYASTIWRME